MKTVPLLRSPFSPGLKRGFEVSQETARAAVKAQCAGKPSYWLVSMPMRRRMGTMVTGSTSARAVMARLKTTCGSDSHSTLNHLQRKQAKGSGSEAAKSSAGGQSATAVPA